MPRYRAYVLDGFDHIRTVEIITADDEMRAVEQARLLAKEHCIEVWDEARRIARIERDR